MNFSAKDIANIIGGEIISVHNKPIVIKDYYFDSRLIIRGKQGLFLDLENDVEKSKRNCQKAIDQGIDVILTRHNHDLEKTIIRHEKPLVAFQKLATEYRKRLVHCQFVAITGSNGKTIVKEWLYHLVQGRFRTFRSPKSYNSQLGVPYSILNIPEDTELAIIEVGISEKNEMEVLQKIVQPDLAVFTHIGDAHAKNFSSIEEKILEKSKLFNPESLSVYFNNSLIKKYLGEYRSSISFGFDANSDLCLLNTKIENSYTTLEVSFKNEKLNIQIPFNDEGSIQNVLCCMAVLMQLSIPITEVQELFKTLPSVEMRLESLEGVRSCTIINDSYNADLESIQLAINVLLNNVEDKNSLILSDIEQTGDVEYTYGEILKIIDLPKINQRYLIGEQWKKYRNTFKEKTFFFDSTEELIEFFRRNPPHKETILVKGARKFQLEKVVDFLSAKVNDTRLEIDFAAMQHNLNFFRSKLQPDTKTLGMVKAFSYGSGGIEIAEFLEQQGVDYLGVAFADEGVELREQGIKLPILVLNASEASIHKIMDYDLQPEVYNLQQLHDWKREIQTRNKPIKVHLKLETGMNRLGFKSHQLQELKKFLTHNSHVQVVSIFSHLAVSDDLNQRKFTQHQYERLMQMVAELKPALNHKPIIHLLNSSGIINYPEYQLDMVRLGIGLYGFIHPELQNVLSLKSHLSQIHDLEPGETVGYNRRFKAIEPTKIGTIPVGYGDGINRHWGNGNGWASINGKKAPIVGDICMDMLMVNLTNINATVGDEVVIFGEKPSIQEMANALDTIPYEIITGISQRVKRVYFK